MRYLVGEGDTIFTHPYRRLGLLLALTSAACRDKPVEVVEQAQPAVAASPDAAAPSAPGNASEATPSNAQLTAFLQQWLDAQNKGDFARYSALYASKFVGIKRAGQRETHFTRADWLTDRARMFKKPITVEAREPKIQAAANTAQVTFTQHFATGNFADVGGKRLLLVREGDGLKIAHEEMLASQLLAKNSPELQTDFDLHFVLTLESGLYLVLPEAGEPTSNAPIKRENEQDNSTLWTTSRSLRDAPVPQLLEKWRGQTVRLDDGCQAKVGELQLISRVVPHFGTVQTWENRHGDQPGGALSAQQQAEQAFELGSKFVAAKLDGCKHGVFAQRTSTGAPVTAERVHDDALVNQARAAFAKLPDVKADQKDYKRDQPEATGNWWGDGPAVEVFRHPGSRQTLVSVVGALDGEGCADFSAHEWAVFELRGKSLVPLQVLPIAANITGVLDLNQDGRLEFLLERVGFDTDFALESPDPNGPAAELTFSFQDCPC